MQNQSVNQSNNHQTKRNSYANYGKQLQNSVSGQQPHQQQQIWPSSLPTGWRREECMRPNGLGTGKSDVYYISPQNQVVRNKQEMQTLLGDKYDIGLFDWRMGKFVMSNNNSNNNTNKSKRLEEPTADTSSASSPSAKVPRVDNQCSLPMRRCPFPITNDVKPVIVRSHPECKRTDVKNTNQETPHQLFWEKRLADHVAIDPDTGESFKPLFLPKGIQSAGVPGYQPVQLVHSLIHALSSSSSKISPIIGQEQQPSAIEKNPCVVINHLQPMIKTFIVTDDDIRRQEARVKELRKKLEIARKKLHPRYETEREG
ncbi:unnamed protein product [Schistosoma margrebowiei]|uniref:MBD domain-containing protein n=1 Tax=Schistosoma margrebowiei TaxID=48269 RepID=A0AA85A2A0_9TREM|nr:unnamed protein product [Schistosoma margrebowiei]